MEGAPVGNRFLFDAAGARMLHEHALDVLAGVGAGVERLLL